MASFFEDFKREWEANAEVFRRNRASDLPSLHELDRCKFERYVLCHRIIIRLSETRIEPADFFDRPELVELIEAAKIVRGTAGIGDVNGLPAVTLVDAVDAARDDTRSSLWGADEG